MRLTKNGCLNEKVERKNERRHKDVKKHALKQGKEKEIAHGGGTDIGRQR